MLRFGIVGTNFVSAWLVAACRRTDGRCEPVAVCSRDLTRAEDFARRNAIEHSFDDLAAMAESVDAVYIASPIAAHHEQALLAIEAGRHVLIEKTMGASASEVEGILTAAAKRGVVAMEGVRNLHAPAHALVRDALPRVGEVRHVRFEKLQYSSRYDRFKAGEAPNAFDPALGNAALSDIGVYCLQPALDLFGTPPRSGGASVWLPNGFEAGGTLQLDYGTLVADLTYSKVANSVTPSVISGEDGSLTIDDMAETSRVVFHDRDGEQTVLLGGPPVAAPDTMHHELLAFADQVDAGVTDPRWSTISLTSRALMDEHLQRAAAVRA